MHVYESALRLSLADGLNWVMLLPPAKHHIFKVTNPHGIRPPPGLVPRPRWNWTTEMKTLTGSGRPRNPDDPLDPNFNPNEEPSYPEAEPDDEPLPDQPLEVPPPITPLTMF